MATSGGARALLWAALCCSACDLGPYPDLREPIDPFVGLSGTESTTFLTANDSRSIFLVLEGGGDEERRFTWTLNPTANGAVVIESGTYRIEDEALTLQIERVFTREAFDRPFSDRVGSTRSAAEAERRYLYALEEERLSLTDGDGVVLELEDLDAVVSRVERMSAAAVLALYRASAVSSQARVVGFGTAAMIEYSTPATFGATVSGEVEVSLRGILEPTTTFDYRGFSDFSGVVLNGPQRTTTNTSGDGYSHGTVELKLFRRGDEAPFFRGEVYYGAADGSEGVVVGDGAPVGGAYVLRRSDRVEAVPSATYQRGVLTEWFESEP